MESHKRYFKNLNTEAVTEKYIDSEKAEEKFEKRLERNEHIVECNKEGVILGSDNKDVIQAYCDISTLKKRLEETIQREIELNVEIDRLIRENNTLKAELHETVVKSTEIKPIETTEDHETIEVVSEVVENETFNSEPVNTNNEEVVETTTKKKPRKMKRNTTKKTKKPVKK